MIFSQEMFQLIHSFHNLRQSLEATYVHPADEGYIGAEENWEYVNKYVQPVSFFRLYVWSLNCNSAMLPPGRRLPLNRALGRRSSLQVHLTSTGLATGLVRLPSSPA